MDSVKAFKEKLDQEHNWPGTYIFKFVVPASQKIELKELFPQESFRERKSKAGNYISFTLEKTISSSDEVVDIYLKARGIEGLIAL
jgi:hypothetical protein